MTNLINVDAFDTCRGQVDIGDTVRRFREAVGYSIEDLALTCGLTCAEITRIEQGADVEPGRLRRIAAALRVPSSMFPAELSEGARTP
ncbi:MULTISPECIES: helix-turn-helix domain-containing protein [Sinorhizobium]|uniref:Helix-turn-helix domain-containing protein n=1 Tax=Sinorhizobium numidicum TaxID=680248 RepID=A0ABY8D330_9HYPH|nr:MULTISPECIES: helix-turn-helix domain-containing protein [Sinorhizobium]MCO5965856.1 helix-turn-helix domain-containing protein [Sinorhizobium meliloti]WEX79334.1 helix-turn-helix domain-containing protein [Sinorhizobium numidicum]WEX85295.1 helix-turn-helix domain-containing protein [Sinorhizobium numidicum]